MKLKLRFSKSTVIMGRDHGHPYILSTTVLSDQYRHYVHAGSVAVTLTVTVVMTVPATCICMHINMLKRKNRFKGKLFFRLWLYIEFCQCLQ